MIRIQSQCCFTHPPFWEGLTFIEMNQLLISGPFCTWSFKITQDNFPQFVGLWGSCGHRETTIHVRITVHRASAAEPWLVKGPHTSLVFEISPEIWNTDAWLCTSNATVMYERHLLTKTESVVSVEMESRWWMRAGKTRRLVGNDEMILWYPTKERENKDWEIPSLLVL